MCRRRPLLGVSLVVLLVAAACSRDTLIATWVESPKRRGNADAYWPHVERIDLTDP